ncbi:hypothetical protein NM688_g3135 [Phlebia brevispora]|uniref:Uncharacterized protein n=1 Tax=Phlebia brevispora TaxID=194682 RepID=A0ACC1T6J5_9APHY|nr:hypothetical protein NM688_g3135 [Phlebia brevispora]
MPRTTKCENHDELLALSISQACASCVFDEDEDLIHDKVTIMVQQSSGVNEFVYRILHFSGARDGVQVGVQNARMDDEANALEALANTLTLLTENPYDISLHAQNVRLARATEMEDQLEAALDMVKTFWAAGDYVWIPLIDIKVKAADLKSAEGLQEILKLFERAEEDYLSIQLLKKHVNFIIQQHKQFQEDGTRPEELGELFSTQWTLDEMQKVVEHGIGHLTESQELWDLQREYIMELLESASGDEKSAPWLSPTPQRTHINYDETFQAYSSFTTNYKPPDQYESLLVQASKSRGLAVKVWQRREESESALAKAKFSLEAYAYYIAAERRTKKPDAFVLTTLYERAIAEADKRRWQGKAVAEEALRSFWAGYLDFLRFTDVEDEIQLKTLKRATRSVPGSGEMWARYIRFLERTGSDDADSEELIKGVYENASSIPIVSSNVEELVPLVLAMASSERRRLDSASEEEQEQIFNHIVSVLTDGIAKVHKASRQGDARLRLEKFFSALCTEVADASAHAVIMWEDATKFYKTSYLAWTAYTELLIKQHLYDDARKVFRDIAMKNLDWPEAIWEAWISFEQLHGSVEQLEDCLDRVNRAREQINARRAKEAEKAAYEAMQVAAEQQAATIPVQDVVQRNGTAHPETYEETTMEVDAEATHTGEEHASGKRKAEDEGHAEGSKKARVGYDRENSTVFVADLPANTAEDDLKAVFKDCGPVREIKLTQLPGSLVATVEFMDRESVPAALTKDKKRIHDHEIAVHLAWKSTLYVTNFPEDADDTFIRELFGKASLFLLIIIKKFKSTRRFCYVQYTSPSAAQAALALHGQELAPGLAMSVFVSNPERRKERTDADANDREVYVAGLSRFVTKEELERLFKTYGPVKEVRMALDDKGQPKGFAFVEFEHEEDAQASLAANNHELKKRRIAVTLADTRRSKRGPGRSVEARGRSVRLRNLPSGTQEGLLQQALEKVARVKRVEVFLDKNEAVAELESPAEASKLLLHPEPIVFSGNTLQLSEESLEAGPARNAAPAGGLTEP